MAANVPLSEEKNSMTKPDLVMSTGLVISTASVLLLGSVAWSSARSDPTVMLCLIVGSVASILGMLLR